MRKAAYQATAERVTAMAEQAWQQPVSYRYFARVRPRYKIPGRRADGTVQGRQLLRRMFHNLIRGFGKTTAFVIDVLLDGGGGVDSRTRKATVNGGADALALTFADALRPNKSDVWIVGSPEHLAVFQAGKNSPVVTLWHATTPHRPVNRESFMALRWPDGSSITFSGPG